MFCYRDWVNSFEILDNYIFCYIDGLSWDMKKDT